jgi:hypothetical protein
MRPGAVFLEPTGIARSRKRVTVIDYPDGRLAIRYKEVATGEPGSDCRKQAPGSDPGLDRRPAKEARHVPFGQGAAATWPEEPHVQGRIDGHPGVAFARCGSFTRRPLDTKNSTRQRKGRLSYPQPGDISKWPKS